MWRMGMLPRVGLQIVNSLIICTSNGEENSLSSEMSSLLYYSPTQFLSSFGLKSFPILDQDRLITFVTKKINQSFQTASLAFLGYPQMKNIKLIENVNSQNVFVQDFRFHDAFQSKKLDLGCDSEKQTQCNSQKKSPLIMKVQCAGNVLTEDRIVIETLENHEGQLICVFDGHGGSYLSEWCSKNICKIIQMQITSQCCDQLVCRTLQNTFMELDRLFQQIHRQKLLHDNSFRQCGCCALLILIRKNKLFVANAGDSEAMLLLQEGQNWEYRTITQRHSVTQKSERERLKKNFPQDPDILVKVNKTVYLKGRLQPTRSLGDFYLKKEEYSQSQRFRGPYISAIPEISVLQIKQQMKYLIVASDGLWDHLSKRKVLQYLTKRELPHFDEGIDKNLQLPFLQQLLRKTLQKCAADAKISYFQLLQTPQKQRRNFQDDISIVAVDLHSL